MANIKINLGSDKTINKTDVYSDFDVNSKFINSTLKDRKAVKQSIINILNYRPQDKILFPSMGNTLWQRLFDNFSSFSKQDIVDEIERILSYEPRIRIIDIDVSTDIKAQGIYVSFSYSIPSLDVIDEKSIVEELSFSVTN